MKSYDTKEVSELSGLSPAQVRTLARDGLMGRRIGRRYRFGFQDLVLARTARRLLDGGVRMAIVRQALKTVAYMANGETKSTAIRIRTEGLDVVIEDASHPYNLVSGQGVMDFSIGGVAERMAPRVIDLKSAKIDEVSADEWYDIGCDLETSEMTAQARVAYERALRENPYHTDAHVNIGRLEAVEGNHKAAEKHYRAALESAPDHALAWYDLGVLYEDQRRPQDAVDAYRSAIKADPGLADAHYNLSMLLEKTDRSGAFRHLSAYKRLKLD